MSVYLNHLNVSFLEKSKYLIKIWSFVYQTFSKNMKTMINNKSKRNAMVLTFVFMSTTAFPLILAFLAELQISTWN